ncbi:hypothetical protein BVG16_16245 [Paenibacillus selenitireducens]|uniref:Uncharacterized protein n=1 Tax=Paenibacillus selenitireducens TaxID=1324314 RepID=A0A1T2XA54_9BACL|nr:hypothetical protein [Paenibacillus selenitireducens]OPA76720.1 hypothetical protein BVG16_16245 [Paenibacillus selenitireducens]
MEVGYVTVFTYLGYEICTMSPAKPGQFGYIINHKMYEDKEFVYIQHAIEAINFAIKRGVL